MPSSFFKGSCLKDEKERFYNKRTKEYDLYNKLIKRGGLKVSRIIRLKIQFFFSIIQC